MLLVASNVALQFINLGACRLHRRLQVLKVWISFEQFRETRRVDVGRGGRRRPVAGAGGGTCMADSDGTDRRCVARVAAGRLVLACPGGVRGMVGVYIYTG